MARIVISSLPGDLQPLRVGKGIERLVAARVARVATKCSFHEAQEVEGEWMVSVVAGELKPALEIVLGVIRKETVLGLRLAGACVVFTSSKDGVERADDLSVVFPPHLVAGRA